MDIQKVNTPSPTSSPKRSNTHILHTLFHVVEVIGLVVIGLITVIAGVQEIVGMIHRGQVHLSDLLLLFIYLEVLAMVIIYLESGRLPIRIPIYIAIVALARYLILDMKEMSEIKILGIAVAIVLLALAVLALRYGHFKFPYPVGDGRRSRVRPPKSFFKEDI